MFTSFKKLSKQYISSTVLCIFIEKKKKYIITNYKYLII